ncbi:MAG TPA: histidine kinase [Acidimicrobiales bacterium]|jgi:signal transduction histidine kinase|nr:histidine kinase [Acidimicrobiales bacterium]
MSDDSGALGGGRRPARSRQALLPRIRSSVLLKVVGALVVAVMVSTVVTGLIASRLTREVLDEQADDQAISHLSLLEEAYKERERELVVTLRNLGQLLTSLGLTAPPRRPDLIAELGRAAGNLELDLLRLVDSEGRELVPPAGVGYGIATPSEVPAAPVSGDAASRLIRTTRGQYVQAVPIRVGEYLLVGGFEFSDAFAYRLRRQIGNTHDVILVASDRVAGTTLSGAPQRPPDAGDDRLPSTPTEVRVGGAERLVAYAPVGRANEPTRASVGVLLTDTVGPLNRSLAQTRLLASVLLTLLVVALGWLLFRAITRPLSRLAATATDIARGDMEASFGVQGTDEVGRLGTALEHMRVELRHKLELVGHQAAALQETSHRIVAAQDDERHRLARDLHDGVQQQLVVLRMRLGLLQEGAASEPEATKYEELGRELDHTIEQMREVTHDLYPSILLDRGLTAALRSYVSRLPVPARFTCSPDPFPRLAPEVESGAYFLLGEAITNALKHSGASEIAVSADVDGDRLVVEVTDDGLGFLPDDVGRRGGLLHMEDRARSLGGQLEIASEPGGGTSVVASFPLGDGSADPTGDGGAAEVPAGASGAVGVSRRRAGGRTGPPPPGG